MSTQDLGPLPEPFMELHRELAPHVYAAWADQMRAYAAKEVAAERERCAQVIVEVASMAVKKYTDNPVRQPYANNRLLHVAWDAADAIRRLPTVTPPATPAC